jgi:hypothetical protein
MRCGIALFALFLLAAPARAQHEHGAAPGALDTAASSELEAVRVALARYEDHEAAVADGYRRFGRDRGPGNALMGEHWFLPGGSRDSVDLERPSTLIYAPIDGEMRLVGVAWSVFRRPGDPLPEGFTGDADHWHVHHVDRIAAAATIGRPLLARIVERRRERGKLGGGDGRTELTMLHAWTGLENPAGPFANDNAALPYARLGLPVEWADPDEPAAARGVGLLLPGFCDRGTSADASAACGEAADRVRAALTDAERGAIDPEAFNAVAADAWRDYRATMLASLTPEQRERMAAMREATTHH